MVSSDSVPKSSRLDKRGQSEVGTGSRAPVEAKGSGASPASGPQ